MVTARLVASTPTSTRRFALLRGEGAHQHLDLRRGLHSLIAAPGFPCVGAKSALAQMLFF